jgi:hypothetical protein
LTLSFSRLLLAPFGTRTLMGFYPSEPSPPKKPSPLSGTSALLPLDHSSVSTLWVTPRHRSLGATLVSRALLLSEVRCLATGG